MKGDRITDLQNKLAALAASEPTITTDHASTMEDEHPSLDSADSSPVVQVCIDYLIKYFQNLYISFLS